MAGSFLACGWVILDRREGGRGKGAGRRRKGGRRGRVWFVRCPFCKTSFRFLHFGRARAVLVLLSLSAPPSVSHSLSLSLSLSLSIYLSMYLSHRNTHTHSLSISFCNSLPLYLYLNHTLDHQLTLTHSNSATNSRTPSSLSLLFVHNSLSLFPSPFYLSFSLTLTFSLSLFSLSLSRLFTINLAKIEKKNRISIICDESGFF